jgi:hypothetical protein
MLSSASTLFIKVMVMRILSALSRCASSAQLGRSSLASSRAYLSSDIRGALTSSSPISDDSEHREGPSSIPDAISDRVGKEAEDKDEE